jgi:hypothetical protein
MADFLYDLDSTVVAILLALLMAAAVEVGYRIGARHREAVGEAARSQVGAIQGATLGLLALLLGFTFSLALERHDARSQALVDEANALGTAWLRLDLLAAPAEAPLRGELAAYIRQRIQTTALPQNEHARHAELAGLESKMQSALWRHASTLSRPESGTAPPYGALFVAAINQALDAHGLHRAALERHVPNVVMLLLLLSFVVSGGIVGYASGVHGHRSLVSTYLMLGLIVVLVYLIVDLDRPRRGLIMVDPSPIAALGDLVADPR